MTEQLVVLNRIAPILIVLALAGPSWLAAQTKSAGSSNAQHISKAVGTIKNIQPDSITLAAESGNDVVAKVTESTKILRVPPGEKDLKNAVALSAQDLQAGDRVLVRGTLTTDGHTIAALAVIVMKQSDVNAKQQQERDDWQKRGVGGLVTKIDAVADTIMVSSGGLGTKRDIAIHLTKDTIFRRYAPGSVKFDDAKAMPISQFTTQTRAGDQLRARGTRSADGGELSAVEVVAGSFRNIAGTIKAVDAANNTITVQDALSKSTVVVKISADSQMKKLPPEMAQRIAVQLKAMDGASGDRSSANGEAHSQMAENGLSTPNAATPRGTAKSGGHASGGGGAPGAGNGGNGAPDLQRVLSRLPNSTLADLQKDDTLMIVATEGATSDNATAITLLAGVDAILMAAPNRAASSLLSPWSLTASSGEGEAAQ
jgi:hypothetical protein